MRATWLGAGKVGALAIFVGAAVLEVLGSYGVVVNLLDLDFSGLLGAYVGSLIVHFGRGT